MRRSRLSRLLAVPLLSSLASGCLTPKVLQLGGGIDWSDPDRVPPHGEVVPDTLVFCARGGIEVHASARAPAGVQWQGHPATPVRVVARAAVGNRVELFDSRDDVCGPIAERARIAVAPQDWEVDAQPPCSADGDRPVRTLDVAPHESSSIALAAELLDVLPARRLELVVQSDLRPELARREPRRAAYALLPLTVVADGAGVATGGAFLAACYSPLLAAAVVLAPAYGVSRLGDQILVHGASASPQGASSLDLSAADFEGSSRLASRSLRCARLVGADLRHATLGRADLAHAKLLGARLSGADLSEARNLTQSQLDAACGDTRTRVPSGLNPPPLCPASPR